jgi:beta-lactamase superfamily II metal-dependent hydrolase
MTRFGPDLPRPLAGELTLYLLGPGVGESVVAVMPDRRVVVVDVCEDRGVNLTLDLLDEIDADQIDLLVVSHPDLDHVGGLARVLGERPPHEVWRYPLEASARDFVLTWARRSGRTELVNAIQAIAKFGRNGSGDMFSVALGDQLWPHSGSPGYRVHALAPTELDKERAIRAFNTRLRKSRSELDAWLDKVASGSRPLGDAPNVISLAIAIEMGDRRVVLGGDVLAGTTSDKSGWKGVLRLLTKHERAHLLTTTAAVKVAHHGSRGAYEESVWALHSAGGPTLALIAPFSSSGLPDEVTLAALRPHARAVLVASTTDAADGRAARAGWTAVGTSRLLSVRAPVVGLRVTATSLSMFVGAAASHLT